MDDTCELTPSELGTKDYWQSFYKREKSNFDGYGDPGEVWFGEESSCRVIRWLEKSGLPKEKSIVDIGCGNGAMLFELRNEGFTDLTGIDYSENGIELAKSVADTSDYNDVKFMVVDITSEVPSHFDIALDKGTYDAVSLDPADALDKRKKYIANVAEMLNEGGLFIITSCNWTDHEIVQHFEERFEFVEKIPTPTFMFGGKVGSIVSSLVFKKRKF